MDYIDFSSWYYFLKDRISGMEKIINEQKVGDRSLICALYREQMLLEKRRKTMAESFCRSFESYEAMYAQKVSEKQLNYFWGLLEYNSELCEGVEWKIVKAVQFAAQNDFSESGLGYFRNYYPEMIQALAHFNVCLFLYRQAAMNELPVLDFAKWLTEFDFCSLKADECLQQMAREMRLCGKVYVSNVKQQALLDLFEKY